MIEYTTVKCHCNDQRGTDCDYYFGTGMKKVSISKGSGQVTKRRKIKPMAICPYCRCNIFLKKLEHHKNICPQNLNQRIPIINQ